MRTVLLAVVVAVLVGCGGGGGEDDPAEEAVVSAAASLTAAFEDLGGATFSFGGSDELAAQIRQGVPVDVFASANTALPQALFEEGLVEEPVIFAGNELVLAVPAEDARVASVDDLTADRVTIAMGSEDVPVGAYTREVVDQLPGAERILGNVRSLEPDVKGIVGKLTQGAVDAGFVYATDVAAAGGALRAIELPADVSPGVEYGVAVVANARHPEAARAFVDSLLGEPGRAALVDAGFSVP